MNDDEDDDRRQADESQRCPAPSPLDVPGIQTDLTLDEILQAIHDGQGRPRSPLDVGYITPRQPVTTADIVAAVREGRERA